LLGIVLIASGIALFFNGMVDRDTGRYAMASDTAKTWSEVLDYELTSPGPSRYEEGEALRSSGTVKAAAGVALVLGGAGVLITPPLLRRKQRPQLTTPVGESASAVHSSLDAADVPRQPCPRCGERIALTAKICR